MAGYDVDNGAGWEGGIGARPLAPSDLSQSGASHGYGRVLGEGERVAYSATPSFAGGFQDPRSTFAAPILRAGPQFAPPGHPMPMYGYPQGGPVYAPQGPGGFGMEPPTRKEKDTLRHLKKAEDDLDELRGALKSAQHRLKERKQERETIKSLKKEMLKMQDRVREMEDAFERESQEKHELDQRVHELEYNLQQEQHKTRQVENHLKEESREKDNRGKSIERLTQELEQLRARENAMERNLTEEQQRRVEPLAKENDMLKRRLAERESQLQDLASWSQAAHVQLQQLQNMRGGSSDEVEHLRSKLQATESQLMDEVAKKQGLHYYLEVQQTKNVETEERLADAYRRASRPLISDRPYAAAGPYATTAGAYPPGRIPPDYRPAPRIIQASPPRYDTYRRDVSPPRMGGLGPGPRLA
mmetsp:Transcript_52090/g.122095  ORF Transcript_52090/g.122095 Transcript_52090/m.122095 type:complete len:415 (+) Transcript_52090:7-1251(+)